MKLILFATLSEAQATIELLKARPEADSIRPIWREGALPTLYRYDEGTIVITDVGLHAASAAFARYHAGHTEVWNAGFAGTLHSHLPLLELVEIREVGKSYAKTHLNDHAKQLAAYILPRLELQKRGFSLISSDAPIHHTKLRKNLADLHFDLVDMEGYAIAYLCQQLNLPCKIWKIVSDFASPGGVALIQKHKKDLTKKLANLFTESHENRCYSQF